MLPVLGVLARALAARYPQRCLWAGNWPHPNQNPVPSSQAMLDWLFHRVGDAETRRRILVVNPGELYGFRDFRE